MIRYKYLIGLIALILLFLGISIIPGGFIGCLEFCLLLTVVLVLLTITDCCETKSSSTTLLLATAALALNWGSLVFPNKWLFLIHNLLFALFFFRCGVNILRPLYFCKSIDLDAICAAICVYVLAGVSFAYIFGVVTLVNDEAFSFARSGNSFLSTFGESSFSDLMYFSFVTMTTLGYGDVTPLSSAAKMIAVVQAIMGQFYMAVLVAKLVVLSEFNSRNEPGDS